MNLLESIRIALVALSSSKLRSALTMLGIIIGVAAVIALMGIGQGAQAAIDSQINSLLFVSPGSTNQGGIRGAEGSAATLTYQDAQALADSQNAPSIAAVAPEMRTFGQIVYRGNNVNAPVSGVTSAYQTVRNYSVAEGDFIKSIGATRGNVLMQFLTAATFLSVLGGLIGLALGIGIALRSGIALSIGIALGIGIAHLISGLNLGSSPLHPVVAPDSVLLATLFALAVGLFFGIYPASRAASLTPVEALRYE